ncbi:hypothetical protein KUTeg_001670 [Tegillarca granosa]|uniref:DUF218 domain-containing protein n=1 Tax=Tegillarca granosa TaxID=220873 RepID=A0ABQ9FWI9_TEGGR|nr:hypothetical protein KUTeg_001670 [Tegillarca granosa]
MISVKIFNITAEYKRLSLTNTNTDHVQQKGESNLKSFPFLVAKQDVCFAVPAQHTAAALKIWNYLKFNQPLKKSDIIIGLGSHDPRLAKEAARLWLDGWAETLMFSGKSGNLTKGKWDKPEAEIFYDIAISMGVPPTSILLETDSTNTGENFKFCYEKLKQLKIVPKRIIVVQKPHMGRRTFATFKKQWPQEANDTEVIVTSQNISLLRYPSDYVGDLTLGRYHCYCRVFTKNADLCCFRVSDTPRNSRFCYKSVHLFKKHWVL